MAEWLIYRSATADYVGAIDGILFGIAVIGTIFLGFTAPNRTMAFFGSVALFTPSISYSMLGYGLLEMGGFLHVISFGMLGAAAHAGAQVYRARKRT